MGNRNRNRNKNRDTKLSVYRGTKLSEATNMMINKIPKKYLYRITDEEEAYGYAELGGLSDKGGKGSILSGTLDISGLDIKNITRQERKETFHNKSKLLNNKIGLYDAGNFKVIITPPAHNTTIKNLKIERVIQM